MTNALAVDPMPLLVKEIVPRENEGGARGAAMRERIRRALAHSYFFGDDAEWLERELWARLDQAPESMLRRRDAAITALAAFYFGSAHSVAKEIASDLGRYGASRWRLRDKNFEAAPLEFSPGSHQSLIFTVLQVSGGEDGVPSVRHIRRILGQNTAAESAQKREHPLTGIKQRKGRNTMNAIVPHSDQKLLASLRQSPEIQKILVDEHAHTVAERKEIITAIAALDAKANRDFVSLDKAVETAVAGGREAEKALRAANDRISKASFAKSAAGIDYSIQRQILAVRLREGVDERIFREFQSEMLDELDKARKQFDVGSVRVKNRMTGFSEDLVFNNGASVQARVAAIRAAMDEAETLPFAADQSLVPARLETLRAGLPKVAPAVQPNEKKS